MEKNLKAFLILLIIASCATPLDDGELFDFPELELDFRPEIFEDLDRPMPPDNLWKNGGCIFKDSSWQCFADNTKEERRKQRQVCSPFIGEDSWFWCMENTSERKNKTTSKDKHTRA